MRRIFSRYKNIARCRLSPCQVRWGCDIARRRGKEKHRLFVCLSVCLSVCLFVTLENGRPKVCPNGFTKKPLKLRSDLISFTGYGKVCSCAPAFNSVSIYAARWCGHRVSKLTMRQNLEFSPLKGDRINRSGRNLALEHRLRVCSSVPNLARKGNGIRTGYPPLKTPK